MKKLQQRSHRNGRSRNEEIREIPRKVIRSEGSVPLLSDRASPPAPAASVWIERFRSCADNPRGRRFSSPDSARRERIAAERRRLGRSVEIRDAQIARIAAARKAVIATRNLRHFEGLGPPLLDLWPG